MRKSLILYKKKLQPCRTLTQSRHCQQIANTPKRQLVGEGNTMRTRGEEIN